MQSHLLINQSLASKIDNLLKSWTQQGMKFASKNEVAENQWFPYQSHHFGSGSGHTSMDYPTYAIVFTASQRTGDINGRDSDLK